MTAPHPAEDLSFLKRRKPKGTGIDFWAVIPSGNHGEDYTTGTALAEEYLAYIGANPTYGNGTLLPCIVRDMLDQAKSGRPWSGVHSGFLREVNRYAMSCAVAVSPPRPVRSERPKLRLVHGGTVGAAS